jgi:hypothetical protein
VYTCAVADWWAMLQAAHLKMLRLAAGWQHGMYRSARTPARLRGGAPPPPPPTHPPPPPPLRLRKCCVFNQMRQCVAVIVAGLCSLRHTWPTQWVSGAAAVAVLTHLDIELEGAAATGYARVVKKPKLACNPRVTRK